MTDKLRELLEDVQTVYEGKGMVVHPNSFDKLRMEVKLLKVLQGISYKEIASYLEIRQESKGKYVLNTI